MKLRRNSKLKVILAVALVLVGAAASSLSSAISLYTKGATPVSFTITLAERTVTYHYPSASDDGTFTSSVVSNIPVGDVIINHAPNTNVITISGHATNTGTYAFAGWYDNADYTGSALTASDLVSVNTDVYAKYTLANCLHYWTGSANVYIGASQASDTVVGANQVEYGTRILGFTAKNGSNTNGDWVTTPTVYPLTTSSGTYQFTRNSTTDWTIMRKIGVKAKPSYWSTSGAKTFVWCSGSAGGSSGQVGTVGDSYSNEFLDGGNTSSWNSITYVDARYTTFSPVRFDPSAASPAGQTSWVSNGLWSQPSDHDIGLTDGDDYSSTAMYILIPDSGNLWWATVSQNG